MTDLTEYPRAANYVAALLDLADDLKALTAQVESLTDPGDLFALSDALYMLRGHRRAVSDLERHIETTVADLMEQDQLNLDDQMTLERRRGSERRQWQSDQIVSALWTQAFADENGVLDPTRQPERFLASIKACAPFTASLAWRSAALSSTSSSPSSTAPPRAWVI